MRTDRIYMSPLHGWTDCNCVLPPLPPSTAATWFATRTGVVGVLPDPGGVRSIEEQNLWNRRPPFNQEGPQEHRLHFHYRYSCRTYKSRSQITVRTEAFGTNPSSGFNVQCGVRAHGTGIYLHSTGAETSRIYFFNMTLSFSWHRLFLATFCSSCTSVRLAYTEI